MHEWLEALRKSAKASSPGVPAEEVRRAETECGVPFPEELGALYQALNGGQLNGDVHLFQLHGPEGSASVLEKSRLKLVGLPAAGVWRIGLKGLHRHLFASRKSAMVEQGDGGGPLPGWMEALSDEDWVYGTWDGEKQELRLYRTLKDMLDVLVPPAEVESFGERTFARAMNAVLQGALSGAEADEEGGEAERAVTEAEAAEAAEAEDVGEVRELAYEYDEDSRRRRDEERSFAGKKPKAEPKKPARPVGMGASKAKEKPVGRAEARSPETGGAGILLPRAASGTGEATETPASEAGAAGVTETAGAEIPAAAPAPKKAKAAKTPRAEAAPVTEAPGEPAAAPVAPEVKGAEVIAAAKKRVAKKAATEPTVTAPPAVTPAPTERPSAKKAAAAPASKLPAAAKKAPAKKAAVATKPAAKKGAAAKKAATKKAPAKKGAAAKKAPAKKAAAKKAPAKKGAAAKKAAARKAPAKKAAARKAPAKKAAVKKAPAKKAPVRKGAAKKAAAKKGTRGR